jgi:type IV secretion system protein VirB10
MADEINPKPDVKCATQEPAQPPQGPMNKPLLVGCVVVALLALIGVTELTRPKTNSAPAKSAARTKTESDTASTVDIANFQRQTQQEAQELARIQAQKEALQRTLEAAQQGPVPNLTNSNEPSSQDTDLNTLAGLRHQQQLAAAGYYQPTQQGGTSPAEQEETERRKKEEQALHASNVALDLRGDRHNQDPERSTAPTPSRSDREAPRDITEQASDSPVTPASNTRESKSAAYDFNSATGKMYRLFEGHLIETVLANRINGAFAGPVNCMVTTDVYAHDNHTLLIPQGSRILGKVNAVVNGNQQRLFVAFHRIIMPDGYSISLDQFGGLNQVGETGLRDLVNHHYLQIFGTSLALAAIGGIAQIGNSYGSYGYDPMVVMRSGISQSMAESSARVLDHFLNQLPTFIVRERTRVKIYLAGDLLLPAYPNHTMPGDL